MHRQAPRNPLLEEWLRRWQPEERQKRVAVSKQGIRSAVGLPQPQVVEEPVAKGAGEEERTWDKVSGAEREAESPLPVLAQEQVRGCALV